MLEWRQLSKLKSTYTDALQAQINPETGRVHTSFSLAVAQTGRLASTDPNLQNIPVRTADGREFRRAFVAEEGAGLLTADYSQIELRVLADLAEDPGLIDVFDRGVDIHTATAAKVLKKAVCRHSVARLVKSPAVNHQRRVTAHRATMTNSAIGVFSRGPLEA